jgi:hypothetical protein
LTPPAAIAQISNLLEVPSFVIRLDILIYRGLACVIGTRERRSVEV